MKTEDLIKQIKDGELEPKEAINKFQNPFEKVSDIEISLHERPIKCGFPSLEQTLYFKQNSPDLVVLAARPGMGKTAIATQIALNIAEHGNVVFFSLEMAKEELKKRMMSVVSEKSKAMLSLAKQHEIEAINRKLKNKKLFIDDTSGLDIHSIVSKTKNFCRTKDLSLIIVDYCQIVTSPNMRSKTEEVALVAEKLKTLAKDLKVPVFTLAQMNRNVESRRYNNKMEEQKMTPMMSDLADSSGIEKWADVVSFLHRDEVYNGSRPGEAELYITKNRNGELGEINMQFSGYLTKFFDKGISL